MLFGRNDFTEIYIKNKIIKKIKYNQIKKDNKFSLDEVLLELFKAWTINGSCRVYELIIQHLNNCYLKKIGIYKNFILIVDMYFSQVYKLEYFRDFH